MNISSSRVSCWIVGLIFFFPSGITSAARVNADVDSLVLTPHVHGIGYAKSRVLNRGSIPRLLEILGDPQHKRYWVNALVVLGFQEDPSVTGNLIDIYSRDTLQDDDADLRAHLAVPFALGAIAANRNDSRALDFLLATVDALLKRIDANGRPTEGELTQLEHLMFGLAVSNQPIAIAKLDSLDAQMKNLTLTNSNRQRFEDAAITAKSIAQRIASEGRDRYFSYHPPSHTEGVASSKGFPDPRQVGAKRHLNSVYSDTEFDADLSAATQKLFNSDTGCTDADVACPVSFSRLGAITTFGSSSDGLNDITTESELNQVFAVAGARVKFVSSLSYCGYFEPDIIGCAQTPGGSIILQTGWSGSSLFVHEFGHNMGLNHRDSCANNLMSSSTCQSCPDNVVNQAECSAFGGGGVTLTLGIEIEGNGSGSVLISPAGQSCQADCSVEVPFGAPVQFTLVPNADSVAGGCSGACTFTMLTPTTRTIRFLSKRAVLAVISVLSSHEVPVAIFVDGFEQP
jgi:hypothetical protein